MMTADKALYGGLHAGSIDYWFVTRKFFAESAYDVPVLTHTPLPDQTGAGPYPITVTIASTSAIVAGSVKVLYGTGTAFDQELVLESDGEPERVGRGHAGRRRERHDPLLHHRRQCRHLARSLSARRGLPVPQLRCRSARGGRGVGRRQEPGAPSGEPESVQCPHDAALRPAGIRRWSNSRSTISPDGSCAPWRAALSSRDATPTFGMAAMRTATRRLAESTLSASPRRDASSPRSCS